MREHSHAQIGLSAKVALRLLRGMRIAQLPRVPNSPRSWTMGLIRLFSRNAVAAPKLDLMPASTLVSFQDRRHFRCRNRRRIRRACEGANSTSSAKLAIAVDLAGQPLESEHTSNMLWTCWDDAFAGLPGTEKVVASRSRGI